MARYVSSVDLRACNEFEVALVDAALVEVAAVTVVEVTLIIAVIVEMWERSGKDRRCRLLELSCKRYLVIMAASSPRLEVTDDVVETAAPASEDLALEALVPRGGTGGGTLPDGTKFGFGGLAALLPFSTAG